MSRSQGQLAQAAALVATCAALVAGCAEPLLGPRVMPHDAVDAAYTLEFRFEGTGYEKQEMLHVTNLLCRSKGAARRMYVEGGQYVFEYWAIPEKGEPILFHRATPFINHAAIQLYISFTPHPLLQPGVYETRLTVTTPSGKTLEHRHDRTLYIRRREMKLTLTSDKVSYELGETIVLTGTVENISGKAIDLSRCTDSEVRLDASYGNSMRVAEAHVPKMLAVGAKHELCVLRFEAGTADARFSRGKMREILPRPFEWPGQYQLELHLELRDREPTVSYYAVAPQNWIEAFPGTCSLRIEEPKAP